MQIEDMPMLTKGMRKAIEAIERALEQPAVTSDTVRPDVAAAFTDVIARSDTVLDYLKDR